MTTLPALTVRQPHATWIVSGCQRLDHRNWSTPHRGLIAIHAAAQSQLPGPDTYPQGCVVGVAELVACVTWIERRRGSQHSMPRFEHTQAVHVGSTSEATFGCSETDAGRLALAGIEFEELAMYRAVDWPILWVFKNAVQFSRAVPAVGDRRLWDWSTSDESVNQLVQTCQA